MLTDTFADGPEILRFVGAAKRAAAQAEDKTYPDDQAAKAIFADERAAWLTHFGFIQSTTIPPLRRDKDDIALPREGYSFFKEEEKHVDTFLSAWQRAAIKLVEAEYVEDGMLVQRLNVVQLEASWLTTYERHYPAVLPVSHRYSTPGKQAKPTTDAMPFHLAYLMADWIGLPWQVEGDTLIRRLPNMPLRLPSRKAPASVETEQRVRVACNAWALMPAHTLDNPTSNPMLVYASLIGQQKELLAIKASIVDAKRGMLFVPFVNDRGNFAYHEARRKPGKGVFHSFIQHLPASDHHHMVMQMREELEPKVGYGFPHIVGSDGAPDLGRLFKQLDIALRLPVDLAWMERIWAMATVADEAAGRPALIEKLESSGCTAYWMRADDDLAWSKIISTCVGGSGAVPMEIFGEVLNVASVEEVISEDDADEDNADEDE